MSDEKEVPFELNHKGGKLGRDRRALRPKKLTWTNPNGKFTNFPNVYTVAAIMAHNHFKYSEMTI